MAIKISGTTVIDDDRDLTVQSATVDGNVDTPAFTALGGLMQFKNGIREKVHTFFGTNLTLNPDSGTIIKHDLTGNTTYNDGMFSGESIILMIENNSGYTINWPTIEWKTENGSAPSLYSTVYNTIVIWKLDNNLFGARVGDL